MKVVGGGSDFDIGYPAAGDVLGIGNKATISWTSSSNDYVKIEISYDNKETWTTIAESVSASDGSYEWTVEGTPSNDCYLRITDINNSSNSKEVGPFSIGYILVYNFKDIFIYQKKSRQNADKSNSGAGFLNL